MPGQAIVGLSFPNTNTQYSILARGDYTISSADHLSVRGTFWNFTNPFANLTAQSYPAAAELSHRYAESVVANYSHVFTPNLVFKANVGWFKYFFSYNFAAGVAPTPVYHFPGLTIGPGFNYPEKFFQRDPQVTPELTWHHLKHDVKVGVDFLGRKDGGFWPLNSRGSVTLATLPANVAALFPLADWNNAAAWNLAGLSSDVTTVTQSFYRNPNIYTPRPTWGVWLGDTWHALSNLTFTLGIRWDADLGQYNPPGLMSTSILITNGFDAPNTQAGYRAGVKVINDWAPRFGVSYAAPHNWVFRAGIGMFYGVNETQLALGPETSNGGQTVLANTFINDGQPGFITNWARGVTAQQYLSGSVPAPPQTLTTFAPDIDDPRVLQVSAGFQKQIGSSWSFDSDFIFSKGTHLANGQDINVFLDPKGSGYALNPSPPLSLNPTGAIIRPDPAYQGITYFETNLISEYMAVASSITKRFSQRWQGSITDTIMIKNNDQGSGGLPSQGFSEIANINNILCPSCEWGRGVGFQRNTFRFNGVYQGPWGVTMSGIVYLGTGSYFDDSYSAPAGRLDLASGQYGDNLLISSTGVTIPANVLSRFNGPATFATGSTLPRDALKGLPLYKTDMRLSKDFKIIERFRFTTMVEAFNVFNHPNYGSYQTVVNLPNFGTPTQDTSISYVPREIQIAFRASF
jgi:hypothetical protein